MTARTGVRVGVKGVGLAFDPAGKGLMTVYDVRARGFRFVNLEQVEYIQCGKRTWGTKPTAGIRGEERMANV